jgi:hypothetical protein
LEQVKPIPLSAYEIEKVSVVRINQLVNLSTAHP